MAHALTIQNVIAGANILTLQFGGTDILAAQRNGPYTLTNILLTDEDTTALVTQQAKDVYVTASYMYTDFVDALSPSVTSIIRANPNPTNSASVHFTVTFSEAVTGVTQEDFLLTTTGVIGANITKTSGSGTTYDVVVNTGSGNGIIRLDVVDNDTIIDLTGNLLGGLSLGDGNYISGEIYTITKSLSPSFSDVPTTHPYFQDIQILYANGLTAGCSTSPLKFCPDQIMNRGESAVFMLRANFGSSFAPGPSTHVFKDDWAKGTWAEPWADAMYTNGLSAGCSSSPLKYCPWDQIPREQAVIFALRMKYGTSYIPPAATGTLFADMTNPGYYATSWAEQAYTDGLIPNCGTSGGKPKICPKALVSRGLGAYMIVKAKNLTMP